MHGAGTYDTGQMKNPYFLGCQVRHLWAFEVAVELLYFGSWIKLQISIDHAGAGMVIYWGLNVELAIVEIWPFTGG